MLLTALLPAVFGKINFCCQSFDCLGVFKIAKHEYCINEALQPTGSAYVIQELLLTLFRLLLDGHLSQGQRLIRTVTDHNGCSSFELIDEPGLHRVVVRIASGLIGLQRWSSTLACRATRVWATSNCVCRHRRASNSAPERRTFVCHLSQHLLDLAYGSIGRRPDLKHDVVLHCEPFASNLISLSCFFGGKSSYRFDCKCGSVQDVDQTVDFCSNSLDDDLPLATASKWSGTPVCVQARSSLLNQVPL